MHRVENSLLILNALILALLIAVPELIYISLVAFIQPEKLIEFESWQNYLTVTLLIANGIMFGFYFNSKFQRKIITWSVSSLLWAGFIVFFINKYEPFLNYWLIWLPHLVMLITSVSALVILCWPNNAFNPDANKDSRPLT